jgi:hypothetical protein
MNDATIPKEALQLIVDNIMKIEEITKHYKTTPLTNWETKEIRRIAQTLLVSLRYQCPEGFI